MDRIEDVWDKGNEQISKDKSFSTKFITKSISENSMSITSKLPKIMWFGLAASLIAAAMFIYNLFFYQQNLPVFISIIGLLLATTLIFSYLIIQLRIIRKLDTKGKDLKNVLLNKVKYLNTSFQWALHLVALSVVFVTMNINLTMENNDGIFELRKIIILSLFYIFIYFVTVFFYKISFGVYIKQLDNALFNLEEKTLRSFDDELKKHKRIRRIIGFIILTAFLLGMIVLIIVT